MLTFQVYNALALLVQCIVYSSIFITSLLTLLTLRQALRTYLTFKSFEKYNIPGPKPTILFGNMLELSFNNLLPHETLGRWSRQYNKVFKYFMANIPILVIKDADVIKEIMTREFSTFPRRLRFSAHVKPLCYSVLDIVGQKWKNQRSVLTPAFSSGKMKLMSQLMNKQTDKFIQVMEEKCQAGGEVDMLENFGALSLDTIGQCALAMQVDCQGNTKDEFYVAVKEYMRFASNPITKSAFVFPFLVPVVEFINNHLTAGKMTSMIVNNIMSIINSRRRDSSQRRVDLLQLMLDAELDPNQVENKNGSAKGLTDNEIVGNCQLFILAGYDTTQNALTYTTYLLALHQDVQEKLYQEIVRSIGDKTPTYEDVHGMVYLEQVISESLRYYPPVALFISRECAKDIQIGDLFIPKDSVVQVPAYNLHHDPNYWPDPEKFDPDRFSPENKSNIVTGSYLPFGIGPRNCVGIRFAQLEMKLALVKLIRKFKLVPGPKTEVPLNIICPTVILMPKNGVYLKLEMR